MNPKQFLQIGGGVLLLVGLLGFGGIIGPTPEKSLFGAFWWFDNYENVVHTLLGVVGILASFVLPHHYQKPLVILLGVVALFFAVYSGLIDMNFLGATLENPADTVLHLVVGVWALWAAMRSEGGMM